jgi:hypothetical protein
MDIERPDLPTSPCHAEGPGGQYRPFWRKGKGEGKGGKTGTEKVAS